MTSIDRIPGQSSLMPGAVTTRGLVWTSGLVSNRVLGGDANVSFVDQANEVVQTLEQVLRAATSSLTQVTSLTVYLASTSDFTTWNEVFVATWPGPRPTRTTIQCAFLVEGVQIEISAVAIADAA